MSWRRARGRANTPANVHELFQALKQEWVVIQVQVIYNVIYNKEDTPSTDAHVTQLQHAKWLNFSWMRRMLKSWTLTLIDCKIRYDALNFQLNFWTTIQFKSKPNMRFFFLILSSECTVLKSKTQTSEQWKQHTLSVKYSLNTTTTKNWQGEPRHLPAPAVPELSELCCVVFLVPDMNSICKA